LNAITLLQFGLKNSLSGAKCLPACVDPW